MTFNELIEKTKNMDLESIGIVLGRPSDKIRTISCFKDGDEWVLRVVTESQRIFERRGDEEYIAIKMYANIKLRTTLHREKVISRASLLDMLAEAALDDTDEVLHEATFKEV